MPNLREHVLHAIEREKIEQAMRDASGVISRASKLLGYKHHHSLVRLLNGRHRDLATLRTIPFRPHRKPIVRPYTGTGKRDPFLPKKQPYSGPDRRERGRWEREAL